ncbi:transposase [Methanospirillum stamsii]|uniref:Winged helix-turn helix domain-containing protein n=1 Tax=Methanospirillum stamsii TaxID=1277351 RepID=A0A2V2MV03_9EURY|nr:helix-turn-helix domain-containing protein [Methanospirillum stamsii]PWR71752.1 hypothetical protein DLD82_13455 [Methanospirillum stamsii]
MINVQQISIIPHITQSDLLKKIKDYELEAKIHKRLTFINLRYSNMSVKEACKLVGISPGTGYTWQDRWNSEGYAGGKPAKLSDVEKDQLYEILHTHNFWTTSEVRELIFLKFSVNYSMDQIRRILKKYKMLFGKLYPQDYRRPENAEEILKKDS